MSIENIIENLPQLIYFLKEANKQGKISDTYYSQTLHMIRKKRLKKGHKQTTFLDIICNCKDLYQNKIYKEIGKNLLYITKIVSKCLVRMLYLVK